MSAPPIDGVARSQRILAAAQVFRLALFVGSTTVLGRYLDPADFGFVALVSTLFMVTTELLDIGTSSVVTRRIVQRPDLEVVTLETLLTSRRAVACLVALIVAIVAGLSSALPLGPGQRIVLLVAAATLPLMSLNTYHIVFQTRQAFGRAVAIGLVVQMIFLATLGLLLFCSRGGSLAGMPVWAVVALLVVTREMAQVLASRFVAVRMLDRRLRANRSLREVMDLSRHCGLFGLGALAYRLSAISGSLLIWTYGTPEAAGRYNAAYRLIGPVTDIAWIIATPLIAALTLASAIDHGIQRIRLASTLQLLVAIAALVAVGGYFVAPTVLTLLYGTRYVDGPDSAVSTLRWLCGAAAFVIITPTLATSCLARGRDPFLLAVTASALLFSLFGNAWLVPAYGPDGAAMMLCAGEAFVTTALVVEIVRNVDFHPGMAWFVSGLTPAIALGFVLPWLARWPLWQLTICATAVPVAVLVLRSTPRQIAWRRALVGDTGSIG